MAAFLTAVSIILTGMPVSTLASENNRCVHHTEHIDCGYSEGSAESACTHLHEDACYVAEENCIRVHDESCGYIAAVEAMPCEFECEACAAEEASAAAVAAVKAMMDALPKLDAVKAMPMEDQKAVYDPCLKRSFRQWLADGISGWSACLCF